MLHQQFTVIFDEGSAVCSYIALGEKPGQCAAQRPAASQPPVAPDHDVRPLTGHVDRSTGGHVESDDHKVWVDVPPSDEQNSVDVRVALKKSDTDAPATVSVGAMSLAVMVDDDSGAPVTKFDDPLIVTVKPYDDDVAFAGGDPSQLNVSQLDPDGSGAAVPVSYAANPDGSVTLQLARLAS